MNPEHIPISR